MSFNALAPAHCSNYNRELELLAHIVSQPYPAISSNSVTTRSRSRSVLHTRTIWQWGA